MKKFSLSLLALVCTLSLARAQGTATQQQMDELRGQYQSAMETLHAQEQRIATLEKDINELREKVNAPAPVNESASSADLKKLAAQVQEIDRKRADDRELILAQLKKLGEVAAQPVTPLPTHRNSNPTRTTTETSETPPSKGYEYEVKPGDNLGLIIKAYRDQGIKVTKTQIIKANPKINPDVLIPGKKIFIPDPSAK
jgi:LysM repeat protein